MRRVILFCLFSLNKQWGGGRGGYAARLFIFLSFPCSADHERDWPPCKVVFFGLATNTLNVRNSNNNNTRVPPQVEKDTTPSGPIFKPELLNNEEGTQHKTVLFRKAPARRDDSNAAFGTVILSAVVISGVEDSVQGGVISHVSYCCIRLNETNL